MAMASLKMLKRFNLFFFFECLFFGSLCCFRFWVFLVYFNFIVTSVVLCSGVVRHSHWFAISRFLWVVNEKILDFECYAAFGFKQGKTQFGSGCRYFFSISRLFVYITIGLCRLHSIPRLLCLFVCRGN
jgi:hypothetical protein